MSCDVKDVLSLFGGLAAIFCIYVIVLHYFPINECMNHDDPHEFSDPSPTGLFTVSLPITMLRKKQ